MTITTLISPLKILTSIVLGILVVIPVTIAATGCTMAPWAIIDDCQFREIGLPGTTESSSTPTGTLSSIIAKLIEYAAIIAVGALTITALMLMMSYGDEGKVKQAKLAITYALIGVVITGAAYTIVSVVNQIQ